MAEGESIVSNDKVREAFEALVLAAAVKNIKAKAPGIGSSSAVTIAVAVVLERDGESYKAAKTRDQWDGFKSGVEWSKGDE